MCVKAVARRFICVRKSVVREIIFILFYFTLKYCVRKVAVGKCLCTYLCTCIEMNLSKGLYRVEGLKIFTICKIAHNFKVVEVK